MIFLDWDEFRENPCRGCEDRHSGCHASCNRFFWHQVAKSRLNQQKRKEHDTCRMAGAKKARAIKELQKHRRY